jgi:hypothetical protein
VEAGTSSWFARSGLDHVVDYTHEDFTESGQRWDFAFQLAGT